MGSREGYGFAEANFMLVRGGSLNCLLFSDFIYTKKTGLEVSGPVFCLPSKEL